MEHQVQIDGISRCSFEDGRLEVRVVHESGQYEDLPCTFQPLIDWIEQVGVEAVIRKLIDHPMVIRIEGGIAASLASVVAPTPAELKQDRQSKESSSHRSSKKTGSTRRSSHRSSSTTDGSAGVRYCSSCKDAVQTVLSYEHGKRMYRCKQCGAITGYS